MSECARSTLVRLSSIKTKQTKKPWINEEKIRRPWTRDRQQTDNLGFSERFAS